MLPLFLVGSNPTASDSLLSISIFLKCPRPTGRGWGDGIRVSLRLALTYARLSKFQGATAWRITWSSSQVEGVLRGNV